MYDPRFPSYGEGREGELAVSLHLPNIRPEPHIQLPANCKISCNRLTLYVRGKARKPRLCNWFKEAVLQLVIAHLKFSACQIVCVCVCVPFLILRKARW